MSKQTQSRCITPCVRARSSAAATSPPNFSKSRRSRRQCESTNTIDIVRRDVRLKRDRHYRVGQRRSHCMRRTIGFQRAAEIAFDIVADVLAALVVKLHTDTRRTIALRATGGDPHDACGEGNLFVFYHEREQHEHIVSERILFFSLYEETAVL